MRSATSCGGRALVDATTRGTPHGRKQRAARAAGGLARLLGAAVALGIVLQFGIVNAAETGVVNVLGPDVAQKRLGGAAAWAAMLTAMTVGVIACGVMMLRWQPRRILRVATYSVFSLAIIVVALAIPAPLPVVIVGAFLTGFGIEIFGVLWDTTYMQEIPQSYCRASRPMTRSVRGC